MTRFPDRVGVVGLGLMGSSLALALRRSHPPLRIVGVDTDATVISRALERGHVDDGGQGLDLAAGCGLVVLATPIPETRRLLPRLSAWPGVLTDLGSTKSSVMAAAATAGVDLVGGHPMCGRELSGIEAARPDLFEGAPWILTRADPTVVEMVLGVGARPLVLAPEEHDRLVAGISHAAFALSAAYMLAVSRSSDWRALAPLAAGGFRDMTRLAAGDPQMYEGIALDNAANLDAWLGQVELVIAQIRQGLSGADGQLLGLFGEAKRARDLWAEERL